MIERVLKFILITIGTVGSLYVFRLYPKALNFILDNWLIFALILIFILYRSIDKLYYKNKFSLARDIYLYFKPEWVNGLFFGIFIFLTMNGNFSEFWGWTILKMYFLFFVLQFYIFYNPLSNEKKTLSLPSTISFYQIIGKTQPIEYNFEDKFNVSKWVDKSANLLLSNRDSNLIIGINGKWGAGKTSLINLIIKELPKDSYITFSSWHYINNSNLSEHLMHSIGSKLDLLTKKINFFSKVFDSAYSSVSNSADSNFGFLYKTAFNLFSIDAKEELNKRLESELDHPLIVFIDDLDRLDKNEFINVIKSIFMLSDLTNIRFVLAYDKFHVLSLLFSEHETYKSIDYFSKLIHFEFSLNTHSESMRRGFCIDLILKLQEFLPLSNDLEQLELFFKDNQSTYYLFKLLETPRELRKILAFSVWSSLDEKGHFTFNPVDMFILSVIQYRIPKLYKVFQAKAEEIKSELCSVMKINQLNYAPSLAKSKKGNTSINKENLLHTLFGVNEDTYAANEVDIINDLLAKLFSPLFGKSVNIDEVLKEKKMCHPTVFEAYLHLEADNFSLQYIELVEEFKKIEPISHEQYIVFFKKHKNILLEHRIWNDFVEYNLFQEDINHIESFLKGLFEISKEFESDEFHNLNTEADIYSRRACQLIAALIKKDYSNEKLIELVNILVDLKPSYGMLSFLIHNMKMPDLKLQHTGLSLTQEEIQTLDNILINYAKDYFFNENSNFSKFDFCGLIYWTQMNEDIKELTIRLISLDQAVLFWLLDFFFRFTFSSSEHLDAIIGFTSLKRIIDERVKFDLLSENEKKLINNFNKQLSILG